MKPLKKNQPPKKKKPLNQWISLTSIAFQMGATILLMAWFGKKIDSNFRFEKPWWTIFFVLLGVVVSVYSVIKQLKKLNQSENEKK